MVKLITNHAYEISKSSCLCFLNMSSSLYFFLSEKRKVEKAAHAPAMGPVSTSRRGLRLEISLILLHAGKGLVFLFSISLGKLLLAT